MSYSQTAFGDWICVEKRSGLVVYVHVGSYFASGDRICQRFPNPAPDTISKRWTQSWMGKPALEKNPLNLFTFFTTAATSWTKRILGFESLAELISLPLSQSLEEEPFATTAATNIWWFFLLWGGNSSALVRLDREHLTIYDFFLILIWIRIRTLTQSSNSCRVWDLPLFTVHYSWILLWCN